METHELEHITRVRKLSPECMVLQKSDGSFPLKEPGKIALYGNAARKTIKAGNDIMMPGTPGYHQDLLNALNNADAAYPITRADLEKCSARMIELAWRSRKQK